jgi:hypothetical protein
MESIIPGEEMIDLGTVAQYSDHSCSSPFVRDGCVGANAKDDCGV